jgi:hypothetical protein
MSKSRTYTYLLPGLANEVNINKSELNNLWLGVENINATFDGNVYAEYDTTCTTYDTKSEYYVNNYTVDDKNLVCYQYPYQDVYNYFVTSKYSKFPSTYKQRVLNYHNLNSKSLQSLILFKSDVLRFKLEHDLGVMLPNDCELGERITFQDESFKINKSCEKQS